MENKKLGITLILISVFIAVIIFSLMSKLAERGEELGCYPADECLDIESSFSIAHIAVGVVTFLFALGVYILVFYKGEEAVVRRLEEEKNKKLAEDKFNIMLRMLDESEQKVLKAIKEQDGITQSTLVLRTGLSRSKASQILSDFERKKLIKRVEKGRTLSVFLTEAL